MRHRRGTFIAGLLAAFAAIPACLQGTASAIVNGNQASFVSAGMVQVEAQRQSGFWNRCGGVLVHAQWVLTAAHCVEEGGTTAQQVSVRTGSTTAGHGTQLWASQSGIHAYWGHDMALVKVDSPAPSGTPLATLANANEYPSTGQTNYIYGWGSGTALKWATHKVNSNWCNDGAGNAYGLSATGSDGYPEASDSGGPLYAADVTQTYGKVYGVLSTMNGSTSCSASVGSARQWIDQTLSAG